MAVAAEAPTPSSPAVSFSWSRMARAGQAGSAFAAVLAAYLLYWLIVVPLIEPTLEEKPIARATDSQINAARETVSVRQRDVAQYFAPDSWELKNPAIWESERARLLFKTLSPLPDGSVELKPCTLLFFSKENGKEQESQARRPIIMRAERAIVRFDEPVVLKSVDLSKRQLVGGHLVGPIYIFQNPSAPGARDDLEITTRDVEMLKDRVWTPHPVQFRLGRHRGSGREMEIKLTSSEAAERGSFRPDGMRTFALMHDVKMNLAISQAGLAPSPGQKRPDQPEPPLEITCQGKFEFEMQKHAASFYDHVNVVQPGLLGEADQMTCELLTVLFDPNRAKSSEPSSPQSAETASAAVRLIQARGNPVIIRSPQRGIYARCPGIDYAPGVNGAAGSFLALGPGVFQRNAPDDPNGKFDATWAREFRFEPDGPQHVARLRGAGTIRFAQMGTVTADEIFAWVTQKPAPAASKPAAGSPNEAGAWQLERVVAQVFAARGERSQGPVVVDSPQLHAITDHLESWVERPVAAASSQPTGPAAASAPPGAAPAQAPPPKRAARPSTTNPSQRFEARGRAIKIKLLPDGDQLAVSEATIDAQAHLQELTPRPGERPLVVKGDRVHVAQANTEAMRVTVSGNPGMVEAGGMTLAGRAIEMERDTNRLWIDGPGRMTMPVEQDLNGQPLPKPQSMAVTWQGGMTFQTNTVTFNGNVVAQSEQQYLSTEKMEAVLSRPVDFARPPRPGGDRPDERPQLARMRCFGPALIRSREFDDKGVQSSINTVRSFDLAIDRLSGELHARGPGTVTRVARGAPRSFEARPGAPAPPPRQPAAGQEEITYLNVTFQNSINGNLNTHQVTFGDSTKTVYGPVTSWDAKLEPDVPGSLGPRGMVLDSKRLTVREMPGAQRGQRGSFELEASGNVVAEGAQFTARGDRLTYSEEKDQIVLRGDQLGDAEFYQDDPAGGPRRESTANELTYWLGLQRVVVSGFRSFNLDAPKAPSRKSEAKK
jgi:lipopolysaccharide export system protein LptA